MKRKCSFCKKEIGFFAKECPYCYENQRKHIYAFFGLCALIIIALFIILSLILL